MDTKGRIWEILPFGGGLVNLLRVTRSLRRCGNVIGFPFCYPAAASVIEQRNYYIVGQEYQHMLWRDIESKRH